MVEKENTDFITTNIQNEAQLPWKISDVLFTYILILALSVVAIGILLISGVDANESLFPAILQVLLSIITLSVIFIIVTKKYNIPFLKAFGISTGKMPSYFIQGITVSFILVISTSLISYVFTEMMGVHRENPYVNVPQEKLRMISIMAVLIAPVVEEIFFRGFMQPALVKSFGIFGGIFLTALVFGLSHAQYLDYSTALAAVITIGLVLGVARHYTNSVVPGIFAHLLNNLFAALSLQ
ncbi:MAG: type II CAAX endopeptidase family protein [Candidatus Gastranaerophilales bacterium]|nr:type II CAAX endopeptidase family protein [Candidatus Gastranaerophilales bacterium]